MESNKLSTVKYTATIVTAREVNGEHTIFGVFCECGCHFSAAASIFSMIGILILILILRVVFFSLRWVWHSYWERTKKKNSIEHGERSLNYALSKRSAKWLRLNTFTIFNLLPIIEDGFFFLSVSLNRSWFWILRLNKIKKKAQPKCVCVCAQNIPPLSD